MAHQPGTGAVREGCALLQGLATCGTCGRKLAVYYDGKHKATPGYYCTGTGQLVEGRGTRHLRVGGVAIDTAVTAAFLAALEPVALQACLQAARQLEQGHDAALEQWRRQVEQARYHAARAERRYQAVDPDNRLVARGLETAWEKGPHRAGRRRDRTRPPPGRPPRGAHQPANAPRSWPSATTCRPSGTRRPPPTRTASSCCAPCWTKSSITVRRDHDGGHADLILRWKGGAISDLTIPVKRKPRPTAPHRRGHHQPGPPARRPLRRRQDRRGSSTGSTAAPPADCHTPPVESRACGTTGASPATRTPQITRKESCSPWPTPPVN